MSDSLLAPYLTPDQTTRVAEIVNREVLADSPVTSTVKSFKEAVKDVKGVAGVAAKAKVSSAEVTGEFDAAELVKALNRAGFHVKVAEKK